MAGSMEQMAGSMERALFFACVCLLVNSAWAEDPYRFFDWDISYGEISPLGVPQQVRQQQSIVLAVQICFYYSVQSTELWNGYHCLKFLSLASWKSLVMRFALAFLHPGNSDQRPVPGTNAWVPDKWQFDHQCPQQLARSVSPLMVWSDPSPQVVALILLSNLIGGF